MAAVGIAEDAVGSRAEAEQLLRRFVADLLFCLVEFFGPDDVVITGRHAMLLQRLPVALQPSQTRTEPDAAQVGHRPASHIDEVLGRDPAHFHVIDTHKVRRHSGQRPVNQDVGPRLPVQEPKDFRRGLCRSQQQGIDTPGQEVFDGLVFNFYVFVGRGDREP